MFQLQEHLKNDSTIQDMMIECMRSTKTMAQVFFEERFYAPFCGLHDQIFDLIDSGAPRIAIAAPRGIGKTSIVGLALAGKSILFRLRKFIPYVNMSFDAAALQTENLKHELVSNKLVRELFGPVKVRIDKDIEETFSKRAWVGLDTMVFPRGSGQQIRGLLYHNARPDLIIIDDLEDPETLENEDVRRKRKEWFNADLLKATSRIDKDYQIVYIDTLKHEDALLESLIESRDWETLRLEICDDNLKSNAPLFISDEEVRREYEYHKEQGIIDVFAREFRNQPIAKEDAVFKPEYFKYYKEHGDRLMVQDGEKTEIVPVNQLITLVICDPAKTVKLQSAESAVLVVSVDRDGHRIFIRDVFADKVKPDMLYDAMFERVKTYKAMYLAVEVTSLHQFISQPIENEMKVRGIYPIYVELKAVGKKEERVAKLAPLYKLGYIYHNPANCIRLENQLTGFPRSKYWDCMDAEGYIPKLMDETLIYFTPDELPEDEDEFAELMEDDEEPLDCAWV